MSMIDFSKLPKTNLPFSSQRLLFKVPHTFRLVFIIFACVWGIMTYQKDSTIAITGAAIFVCLAIISAFLIRPAKKRDTRMIIDSNNKIYDIYAQFAQSNAWVTQDITEQIPEDVLDAYFGLRFYTNISERKTNHKKYIQRAQVISGSTPNTSFNLYYLYETPSYLFKAKIGKFIGYSGPVGFLRVNNEQIRYIVTGTFLDYEMKDFFAKQLGYAE